MTAATRMPRLCRGLALVPDGDALLVDGSLRRRRLTGKTATSLLPRVLPVLDGTRPVQEIAVAADLGDATVERLLAVLDDCDLLEWPHQQAGAAPGQVGHVTAYFSRTISVVAGASSTEELAATLDGSAALVIADGTVATWVAEDLAENGVGHVHVRDSARPLTAADLALLARSARRLVAVLDDDGRALADAVTLSRGLGIPVLRFACGADAVETGPVFLGGWTSCVPCFRAGYVTASSGEPCAPEPSGLAAALVTAEIMARLGHTGAPSQPWRLTRVIASTWRTESFDLLPATGCPACGHTAPPADTGAAAAAALGYEWQHEARPAVLMAPRIRTRDRIRRLAVLQQERDPFPPAPARKLDGELAGCAARLAEILARTAGLRKLPAAGSFVDRWAPSGGNLGSVQLYVAAERNLFGLPGTLFRYDDLGHRVLSVRADRVPPDSLLTGTGVAPGDVLVVFVASVGRISAKYEDFALRLSHLDAGCAALQLTVSAATRGVRTWFAAGWSPALAGLLELDPDGELVTAIAVLDADSLDGDATCP
jgi:SagB-type dehydrogenase family enzyme